MRKVLAMKGRMILVSILVAAVVLVTGGVVLANHGGIPMDNSTDPILGCYKNQNPTEGKGALRVVPDNTVDCKQNETPIKWLAAVPGPPGLQGPPGGLNNVTFVFSDSVIADQTFAGGTSDAAVCPTGTLATGGGWSITGTIGVGSTIDPFRVMTSAPFGSMQGWQVFIRRSGALNGRAWGVRTFAICAS